MNNGEGNKKRKPNSHVRELEADRLPYPKEVLKF